MTQKIVMKNILNKNIRDFSVYTFAFGLYIFSQQVLIMPIISRNTNEKIFSEIILFITFFNIFCIVIGDELSNTRIARNKVYDKKYADGDFFYLLFFLTICLIFLVIIANIFINISWLKIFIFCLIISLGVSRYFLMSFYKIDQKFKSILKANIFYLFGSICGLFLFFNYQLLYAPFLVAEILSILFICLDLFYLNKHSITFERTREFENTKKMFSNLSITAIIINLISYMDRVIILPILGASSMAIYFSASSTSKILALIANPLSSFLLSKMGTNDNLDKKNILRFAIKYFLPMIIVFFSASLILCFIAINFLYPQYYFPAINLIYPISLAVSLSLVNILFKPFLILTVKSKLVLYSNIFYALTFMLSIYPMVYFGGLYGFACSVALGRLIQLLCYIKIIFKQNYKIAN
tara:strand:- start:6150 stop:7379 length:1230 start_codon:yes stop_codon:yes gene_type:complete